MRQEREQEIAFSHKVGIAVAIVILTLLLIVLVYYAIDVLLIIFSAALLAIFLRGLALPVAKRTGFSEIWSVLAVSVLLILVLAAVIAALTPSVTEQVSLLRVKLPQSAQATADYVSQYRIGQALIANIPSVSESLAMIEPASLASRVSGVFSSTIGAVGNLFIVILLSVYIAAEPRIYTQGFTRLFPLSRRERVMEIINETGETLRWWLIGKAGSMIFIGVLTWIGLTILGVPLALTLGLIAGLLSFIPNFGPIIAAVPALLLAFINSPISALYVLALYVGVQIVEGSLVTPMIERRTVELPPALTIVFQVTLGIFLGGVGLILATPLLAMLLVVIQLAYVEDVLGDKKVAETSKTDGEAKAEEAPEADAEQV